MRQALRAKHELRLYELKKAANEFLEFTEYLTLLQAVNSKVQEVTQAVNLQQLLLQQELVGDELVKALNESEAAILFDEIVDADAMSGLEVYILSAAENIEDAEITLFLTEFIDRVELKYDRLLEKVHAYNALLTD
jgi:fructose-specific component phosphotransferase system IIB-like protein